MTWQDFLLYYFNIINKVEVWNSARAMTRGVPCEPMVAEYWSVDSQSTHTMRGTEREARLLQTDLLRQCQGTHGCVQPQLPVEWTMIWTTPRVSLLRNYILLDVASSHHDLWVQWPLSPSLQTRCEQRIIILCCGGYNPFYIKASKRKRANLLCYA